MAFLKLKNLFFFFGILYLVQGGPLFTPQSFKFQMFFGNCGSFGAYFNPSPILRCQCGFFMSFCNKEILIPEKGPLMRSENSTTMSPLNTTTAAKVIVPVRTGLPGIPGSPGVPVVPVGDQPVGSIEVKNEEGVRVLPVINNLTGQKPKEIESPQAPAPAEPVQEKKTKKTKNSEKPQVEEKEAEIVVKKDEPVPAPDENAGKVDESK